MAEEKKGFFKRLVSGLTKTRDNIVAGFDSLFTGYSTIDDDFYEELEEILIMGDIGINATTAILDKLKDQVEIRNIRDPKECKQLLIDTIKEQMTVDSTEYEFENRKSVILVIGVNGVGKTTSVGKLDNKKNLMEELRKIYRILEKEYPEAYLETLVVLDGTTGQNALVQARQFAEVANVTGIILTKLDGTAKGGIAVAIQSELDIPVKYIGVGESIDDLQKFDANSFVDALFDIHPDEN